MMIFYLQQVGVIPVLQELYDGEKPEVGGRRGQYFFPGVESQHRRHILSTLWLQHRFEDLLSFGVGVVPTIETFCVFRGKRLAISFGSLSTYSIEHSLSVPLIMVYFPPLVLRIFLNRGDSSRCLNFLV